MMGRAQRSQTGGSDGRFAVHGTTERLVAEGHEPWEREATGNGSDSDRQRLRELKVVEDYE